MIRAIAFSPFPGASAQPVLRLVIAATAAGALLAVLGPFGTYLNGGPVSRAAYWIGSMLLGLVLYGGAFKAVGFVAAPASRGRWPALIAAALLASVPEAFATRAGAFWLWPDLARLSLSFPTWFAQTATIGIICIAVMEFIRLRGTRLQSEENVSPLPAHARAPSLAGDILGNHALRAAFLIS